MRRRLAAAAVLASLVAGGCAERSHEPAPAPAPAGEPAPAARHETRAAPAPDAPLLRVVARIALPGVRGRLDHMALDARRDRLWVAALGNGSVEVVDLRGGARVQSVPGLAEPQGIAFAPAADRVVVACGGDGTVRVLDAADGREVASLAAGDDADNAHADAEGRRVVVAFGDGGLAAVDAASPGAPRVLVDGFDSHPEGFAVDAAGRRAWVNLASRGEVAVCDLEAGSVTARWSAGSGANFPMALDEAAGRVWIGCRAPARLVALALGDGRVAATADCSGDPDDVFVDAANGRVLVACGSGAVDVFDRTTAARIGSVPTEPGARTALLDAEGGRLFVAAPRRGTGEAAVLVLSIR